MLICYHRVRTSGIKKEASIDKNVGKCPSSCQRHHLSCLVLFLLHTRRYFKPFAFMCFRKCLTTTEKDQGKVLKGDCVS